MVTKNYGIPPVSGYSDPSGRAWETLVYEANAYVTDRELNLTQDVRDELSKANKRSGWVSSTFVNSSAPVSDIFVISSTANQLKMSAQLAMVNGWRIPVNHTNATGTNQLDLGAGPSGVGTHRIDMVILEVWRRLISPSPSTTGKSATGLIWQNGNVFTNPAADVSLNFTDDLLDMNVGTETTKRVQIQYRLRVVAGVDLESYPMGINDPTVFANTVPASAGAPNGTVTAHTYLNQGSNGDIGLWRAGDGNPTNTLGTVDGYMYAIPLCAVVRRNTAAFARRTNQNGGLATPGPSDRPDGLFHDIIAAQDLLDLRNGSQGFDLSEVLQKNLNLVLDNNHHTEIGSTSPFGGGSLGSTFLTADEIGVAMGHGGDGILTGTTGAGALIGEFDNVRRRFSDRPVMETVTISVTPVGAVWVNGEVSTIDPTNLTIYPYAALNWAAFAPSGTQIFDIVSAEFSGTVSPKLSLNAEPLISSVTGLGSSVLSSIVITFGNLAIAGLTNETLYVTLLVGYPNGSGLTRTPIADFGTPSFSLTNGNPAGTGVTFGAFATRSFSNSNREVDIEYNTTSLSYTFPSNTSTTLVHLRERVESVTSLLLGVVSTSFVLDASGRFLTLNALPASGTFTITYVARRPMPQTGQFQMCIYYRAAAAQMIADAHLPSSLQVIPRLVSRELLSIVTGSGSQNESYPFSQAYVQLGGLKGTGADPFTGEHEFTGSNNISVPGLDITTGMLHLPAMIPMVANPENLTLTRTFGADIDPEGRSYYSGVTSGYVPSSYAVTLTTPDKHRNALAMIGELAADTAFGHAGNLVLVVFHRYAAFDDVNYFAFDNDPDNSTTASIYRLKGLL